MDTNLYNTEISLTLRPIWHNEPPELEITIDNQTQQIKLTDTQIFNFQTHSLPRNIVVSIKLINKKDSDVVPDKNLDKAVIIDMLTVNGISDSRFVWAGEYRPDYPEPWYSQQQDKPPALLKNHNYLGWNGVWAVSIQVPAFLWMHQLLGLGWIYD
jgi:hypothetical protein